MEDLYARLMEVDSISLWLVIMMSAAGAYYLSYMFTGMFAAAVGFCGFVLAGLTTIAIAKAYGFSLTGDGVFDVIAAATIGMVVSIGLVIGFITLLRAVEPEPEFKD